MAWRFLMQPNGLLARWSDVVDNFTHCNLSPEEAFEEADKHMGHDDARAKVERGRFRGVDSEGGWNECLATIAAVHGEAIRDAVVKEILEEES